MKRWLAAALVAFFASGCGTVKHFKVFTEPADAEIKVVSGAELKETKYRAPADIIAEVPGDSALKNRALLTVQRDNYKPFIAQLVNIEEGQILNIKLEKLVQNQGSFKLSIRLVNPEVSDALQYRDKMSAFSFAVGDQSFQMRFENLTTHDVKILWDRSEYTDVYRHPHRLMHSGIRYPDRNNPIPDQIVLSRAVVQEGVIPVSSVVFSQQKKAYTLKPLFPLDAGTAGLKGKVFNLFIPVEIDRQIVPYNFRFEITGVEKEAARE